jgi:hypothetical protein
MGERIAVVSAIILCAAVAACTQPVRPAENPAPTPRDRVSTRDPDVAGTGPFDGLRWSGRPVPVGRLLHDDGTRLWSLGLDGSREPVWRHPPAAVTTVAASAGGRRIALGVTAEDRRHLSPRDPSAFLYVLEPDGSIGRIDTLDGFRVVTSPVFLRAPTEPAGPQRLYWIRFSDGIDDAGRLATQVMVDDGGPRRVVVPLRYAEGVIDLHAYPGGSAFTLTLFRQNDIPTRFAILRNDDGSGATDAALTLWGANEARADTDSGVGVAWTTERDYVVPVVHEFHPDGYTLRRFRLGCEPEGSEVVYAGREIDRGYEDLPWHLLPAGRSRVLVLTDRDARGIVAGTVGRIAWHAVDLDSGRLRPTQVPWPRDGGGWAWVSPPPREQVRDGCGDTRWVYP